MKSFILSVAVVGFALCPVLGVRCYGAEPATTQVPWKAHVVRQLNGAAAAFRIPAKLKILTEPWNRVVAMPWMVYMPEKDRLMMLVAVDNPHQAAVLFSDDRGTTWSKPRYLHVDAQGKSDIGFSGRLAYLGNGKLVAVTETGRLLSGDYGKTWRVAPDLLPSLPDGKEGRLYGGPNLGDRAPVTGKVARLVGNGFSVEKGVGQGYVKAQNVLGWMYGQGLGVPVDHEEAIRWLRKAAKQGSVVARAALGTYRLKPLLDKALPIKWYREFAEQGNAAAQHRLGIMYCDGRGTSKDSVRGYAWLSIAASNGHVGSRKKKETLAKKMTKEQIAEGQKMSRELFKKIAPLPKK
jgi:hypothetical protein